MFGLMRLSRSRCLPACLFVVLIPAVALADAGTGSPQAELRSWPQFRGPERDGTVTKSGLADAWPESGPVELWRRPVGTGFSAVVVEAGLAYTMEALENEEAVLAVDAATGETRWRTVIGVPMESEFGRGPRTTPTLADGRLFTISSQAQMAVLDAATGKLLWNKDLTGYEPAPRFGYAASPLVLGDEVLVAIGTKDLVDAARATREAQVEAEAKVAQGDESGEREAAGEETGETDKPQLEVPPQVGAIAAFDVATGELKWRGGFPGPSGYSSPIVLTLDGVSQIVVVRRDSTVGMTMDGHGLWTFSTQPTAAIAMPVQLSDDTIFVSSSDDNFGGKALRVSHGDDGSWSVEEAWSERLMRNHFNTSVAVEGVLYGFDNTTFKALDGATGRRLWAQRGFGKGSLLAAGDLLYVLGDTGELALVHADREGYRETGRVQAMSGKAWTSPSLAEGRIFLRDHDEMVAYDVRSSAFASIASPDSAVQEAKPAPVAGELSAADVAEKARAAERASGLSAAEVLARHSEARGGLERWHQVTSLDLRGTYNAFSESSDFVLRSLRRRDQDLYLLRYDLFGSAAVRAVDAEGAWLQHAFLSPEPVRVHAVPDLAAYEPQMLREAFFGPLLLDALAEGLTVERSGVGEINGRPTLDLTVTWPSAEPAETTGPITEIWHLDPETFLEVAVDSWIVDYTQSGAPMRQRAFTSDFRDVEGVKIPFRVDLEFNARFEGMTVESVTVNPHLEISDFAPPPSAAPDAAATPDGETSSK